jgi:hypothetical protein
MVTEREITAIHEAGHCVAAESFNLPCYRIKKAVIFPNKEENGKTDFEVLSIFTRFFRFICVNSDEKPIFLMSGNIAQLHFYEGSLIFPSDDRELEKLLSFDKDLCSLFRDRKPIDRDIIISKTKKILFNENFEALREIARVMNEKGEISGDEIREIIARTRKN